MKSIYLLVLGSTTVLSLLAGACAVEDGSLVRPADSLDQPASTVPTETTPPSRSPRPTATQPPPPITGEVPQPSPVPEATSAPPPRFQLSINGEVPPPEQNVMAIFNGSVSILPPAGLDGKYDAGSQVVLEGLADSPDASFTWGGVDRQTGSGAVVTIDQDRSVVVEILVPTPIPTPTEVPTPTLTPVPAVLATAVPPEDQFGWIGGTVRERWPGNNSRLSDVSVEGQLSGHKARTDSQGRYTMFLPVGLEFVTFSSPDTNYAGVKAFSVRPGRTVRTLDFVFDVGDLGPCVGILPFTIEGEVLDGQVPVEGARVKLWDTPHETTTDENGRYSIQDVCGELVLAELGSLRGGILVEPRPGSVIQARKIILSSG